MENNNWGVSINNDFIDTGRRFKVVINNKDREGSAVKFLNWGGVVILIDGEEKPRTFPLSETIEI